ncbi:putative Leucine-rich repeat transmembrane protein kinase family protein [Tripterygium wilfordii]|uniref:Putative Leucine-rich repeat transmembrane protein kinase family protein n=1 Tax=Tripterygium wilfordii TaxID=458696 RepID=A0A7J7DPV7_TRIWF|nr:probable leucine-rich repeat receptor-like protein kinase At1g68400 [Tripterygium wilfordii]KAF5748323.1 putative Leucine-rich repeat transmembrane protein kinase family protein [Tripterygium wilfordii]
MFGKKASFNFTLVLLFSFSLSSPDFAALLSFKASSDPFDSLSSWVSSSASNPCLDSWLGVTCNPVTHRVTRLVLENLNLTGPIDSLSGLTQLRLLSLEKNYLSSSSSLNLSLWPNIKHLYLSHNRFAGNFPDGVSTLRRLLRLELSYNNFSGGIPLNELARLTRLLTLRLEANLFTGTLDSGDSSIYSLVDFNVSGNKLSGEIPTWLSRFPRSSFTGNENLCGEPLLLSCSNRTVPSEPVRSDNHGSRGPSKAVVLIIVIIDTVAIVAALVTVTWCCRYKARAHRDVTTKPNNKAHSFVGPHTEPRVDEEKMVAFEGCKGFSKVDDLLKSSAELLGKGTVGTTYKVVMDGGGVVVVKRVRDNLRTKNLDGWLRLIGGIRHSNILSLRAYYHSKEELLLVYDFLPNGTLHSLLHGNRGPWRTPLDWTTRLRLASGAAEGLAFLHSYSKAKLFHGHVTSSNIIVDHHGNACVSDIGLHQLLQTPKWTNNDYKPPELTLSSSNNRNYTQKSDVYSFGVVVLEILTGKMASGEGQESLVKWVQSLGREEWTWEVFDYELMRYKENKQEMVALMEVGLLCLTSLGKDRPKMSMVHSMIEGIRTKGAIGGVNCVVNNLSSDSSPALSEGTRTNSIGRQL